MRLTLPQMFMFFFFQAEDGIRDYKVTGVQTCALPIYNLGGYPRKNSALRRLLGAKRGPLRKRSRPSFLFPVPSARGGVASPSLRDRGEERGHHVDRGDRLREDPVESYPDPTPLSRTV